MARQVPRRDFLRSAAAGTAFLSAGGLALLAACSDETEPTTTPTTGTTGATGTTGTIEEPVSLATQLAWLRIVQFGGHLVAQENGWFEEEGIDAEFLAGGPNIDPVADVAAGRIPIGDSDTASLILARSSGIPVKAFGAIFQKDPFSLMSLTEDPILSLQEMVGKTIGVPDVYVPTLLALFKGIDIDEESVDVVPVGVDPSILSTGQVDGYMGSATAQGVQLQNRGVDIEIVSVTELGDTSYGNCFFVLDDTFDTMRDSLVNWLRADVRGWQFAVDSPDETANIVTELYGQETGVKLEDEIESANQQVEYITAGDGTTKGLCWIDPARWDTVSANLVNAEVIDEPIPSSEIMTEEILEAVHG